jgi:hypothetical protein
MSVSRPVFSRAVLATIAIVLVAEVGAVRAQDSEPPINAPVQAGPLTLSPTIQLANLGYDSNPGGASVDQNQKGSFNSTVRGTVDGWLKLAHFRVTGHNYTTGYYFKGFSNFDAVDTDSSVRIDAPLNRLSPYFVGTLVDTRQVQNLEINTIARRQTLDGKIGTALRVTENVALGAYVGRSSFSYAPNSLYLGTDLSHQLNHTSTLEGVDVRYAVTPFTALRVAVEEQQDRFQFNVSDNGPSLRVTPSVEFSPHAVISGHASFGFQRFKFDNGGPEFKGTTAAADLNYTLLGQTQFALGVTRDLQYSYLIGNYLMTRFTLLVTERISRSWEFGGSVGRARLDYGGTSAALLTQSPLADATFLSFGATAAYQLNHMKLGVLGDYGSTTPDAPELFGVYKRFRIGSTVTYTF